MSGYRVKCSRCFGTGHAGMLAPNVSDCVYRADPTCRICEGRGYIGKPSFRRRFYEWLSAPERVREHTVASAKDSKEEE